MIDRNDIALDDNYHLQDTVDDFVESDSTQTDAELICILEKGELRYAPWLGFGIQSRLRGVSDMRRFVRELKVELESDSFENPDVVVNKSDLSDFKIYV